MVTPVDPTATAFLMVENRKMPMHVGSLQMFEKPEGAGPDYGRELYEQLRSVDKIAPLFLKHPKRSLSAAGHYTWVEDDLFDIDHHVRHSALPAPGRVRELLDLLSRLHGSRLPHERPLWEAHVIEGLDDGRIALYTKMHHSLVDGISAMRLLRCALSSDPDQRNMTAPWAARPSAEESDGAETESEIMRTLTRVPMKAMQSALSISAEAAGLPGALVRTLNRGVRNETSAVSLYAPRTIFNQDITGSRRFAAQRWPIERLRAIGKAGGTTINDVVLAMCSGAVRSYLIELDALPESTLVSMVPVGMNAKQVNTASTEGGNAVGAVMVRLGTDLIDPAERLDSVHRSMVEGKRALAAMTPLQILATSAVGMAPAILTPLLHMQGVVRPPFNLIISNVPGPRSTQYYNGAKLVGLYPLSVPIHGMALNITCTSYDGQIGFGLTGCRRTLPSLQRLLIHLDDELDALEQAVGL